MLFILDYTSILLIGLGLYMNGLKLVVNAGPLKRTLRHRNIEFLPPPPPPPPPPHTHTHMGILKSYCSIDH